MNRVALMVTVEFEPQSRDAVLRALLDHRERCLKEEPGTLQFEVLVPLEDPSRLLLFELYADDSALSLHSKGSSIARFRGEVAGKVLRVTSTRCIPGDELGP